MKEHLKIKDLLVGQRLGIGDIPQLHQPLQWTYHGVELQRTDPLEQRPSVAHIKVGRCHLTEALHRIPATGRVLFDLHQ